MSFKEIEDFKNEVSKKLSEEFEAECKTEEDIILMNLATILATTYVQTGQTFVPYLKKKHQDRVVNIMLRMIRRGVAIVEESIEAEYDA